VCSAVKTVGNEKEIQEVYQVLELSKIMLSRLLQKLFFGYQQICQQKNRPISQPVFV